MKDSIRRLPDAELEVMQAVWACKSPVTRTDVEKILFQTHLRNLFYFVILCHNAYIHLLFPYHHNIYKN